MNRLLIVLLVMSSLFTFGQSTEKYNSIYANYYKAEELFQKQQYGSARKEFRVFVNQLNQPNDPLYIKALYYEGVAALELFNNDAVPLLKQFLQDYPETIYKNTIYFKLGNHYYRSKDYKEALAYYSKFSVKDLDKNDHDEYYFKVGYSNFQEGQFDAARNAFVEIKDGESQYAPSALYFFSHISYTEKNYQTALEGFLKLEQDKGFGKVVPYYILQIYYLQGKYDEVTHYAPKLEGATIVNEKDINHLVGDAYYRTGKYDESVPYLEKYDKLSETTRDDDYQLGYAYYRSGQFEKAIRLFDRSIKQQNDSLAQVAYYHVGESYLKLKNNLAARSAFQKASEINKDVKLQEDALYQYAVLSYKLDVNPYSESIIAFETYLNNYPNSKRREDIYQYLVNVYTNTKNYEKALQSLDRVNNLDITLRKAYQLIAYNYGIELFQKERYQESINTLKLVDKYPINPQLSAQAVYWMADAAYLQNSFSNAITGYRNYLSMPGATSESLKADAYYNIGYSNLYKGDTTSAIESFRTYAQLKPSDKKKLSDAYMRLADSYFMRRENQSAIQYYDLALGLNVGNQDQALYYKGMTHGVKNEKQEKVTALLNLVNNYSKSKYVQDALFEIAFTYKLIPDYPKAIRYFEQLLTDYPSTSKEAFIRIELADVYYKQNNYKQSEVEYLKVLEKYSHDTICNAVGEGLQHVYAATKQVSKLEEYSKRYPCLNINTMTLENLVYNPAELEYNAKKFEVAIPKFEEYLQKYPQGFHAKKARAFLADCYFEIDNMPKAIENYELVLAEATNNYTELALIRVARYHFNSTSYDKAIPYYERTLSVSSDPEILFNAQSGLMRSYYFVKDYTPASAQAKNVLKNNLIKADGKLEAHFILGMSSYATKNYEDAITSLNYVSKSTTKDIASESKFMIAQAYFDQQKWKESEEVAKEVMSMKPSYDFWIAKSLILQSKVFIQKGDLFQAEQTVNSVLQHYPKTDDGIKAEAQVVYDELMQIKATPKSNIMPDGTTIIEINQGE